MPKPVLFEPPKKRKRKRKKRKVDYGPLLVAPPVVNTPCTHTKKVQDASSCSQCMLVKPSVIKKPVTVDWWRDDPEIELYIEDIDVPVVELDDENGFIDLKTDDE